MQQVVTLVKHFPAHGDNARGPWTRHDFKDAGGNKYQTFDAELGMKASQLLNQPVEIVYEVESRGQYQNNVLKSVKPAGQVPQAGPSLEASPPLAGQTYTYTPDPGIVTEPERQLRIMRQSALDRAINTAAAGIVTVNGVDQLYSLADAYIDYFQNGTAPSPDDDIRF